MTGYTKLVSLSVSYNIYFLFHIIFYLFIIHPTVVIYRTLDNVKLVSIWMIMEMKITNNTNLWKEMTISALSLSNSVKVKRECFAHTSKAFMKTIRASYGSKFHKFLVCKLQREILRLINIYSSIMYSLQC